MGAKKEQIIWKNMILILSPDIRPLRNKTPKGILMSSIIQEKNKNAVLESQWSVGSVVSNGD
jgi:hypothetical protein